MINKTFVKNALACKPLDRKPTKEEIAAIKAGTLPLPKGLTWRIYNTGRIGIQITFTYKGVSCREILKDLTHKKSDINYAIARQGEINAEKARGTFKYADYFPESNNLEKFGEAKSNSTLNDYINKYINENVMKGKKSPSTLKKYFKAKNMLHDMLEYKIIDINQKKLKEHFLNEKRSLASCSISFGLLKNALADAVLEEVIQYNPCDGFKYSKYINKDQKINNTSNEADPFLLEEVTAILEQAENYKIYPQFGAMVQFWFNTGLRTQEILGLKWENVDLKNKVIHVRIGMYRGTEKNTLKNKRAKRDVPLNKAAVEALEKQMPLTFFKKGFVFIDERRNIFQDDRKIMRVWESVLIRANVRYRPPYNCRHTYATMQISSKNDVNNWELIQWMGHSSLDMLEKHYASFKKAYSEVDSKIGLSLTLLPQNQVQNKCITQ